MNELPKPIKIEEKAARGETHLDDEERITTMRKGMLKPS
jgi:hypothetical protein